MTDKELMAKMAEALRVFASITPSSFYPSDGSEAEAYFVLLQDHYANPAEFTGRDLANARDALSLYDSRISSSPREGGE